MSDDFHRDQFPSVERLVQVLRERSDDFEGVKIVVAGDVEFTSPIGKSETINGCCGAIETCEGESILIHREDLEILLNDGILQRLKIPISLVPGKST